MRDTTTYATEPKPGARTAHAYDVEAEGQEPNRLGENEVVRITFSVWANNRDQAARRVEAGGWRVRSVNMTG